MPQWRRPTFKSTTVVGGKRTRKRKRFEFSPDRQDVPEVQTRPRDVQVEEPQELVEDVNQKQQSTYSKNKERDLADWDNLRPTLLSAYLESFAPMSEVCQLCSEALVQPIRCTDCGPCYIVCEPCAFRDHAIRPLHYTEKFQDGLYSPCQLVPNMRTLHSMQCDQPSGLLNMTVLDNMGRLHTHNVHYCKCKPAVVSLMELGIWPNNPSKPSVGYSLGFLELANSLLLESHTSLKGFINSVAHKNQLTVKEGLSLYRMLVAESFYEFRHLVRLVSERRAVRDPNTCPACPQDNPIISLDGNFGLVHKRSAGKSAAQPKSTTMFLSEEEVQASSVDDSAPLNVQDCSNFQAGDHVRAQVKSKKLDITGVFGAVCKHEVPLKFLDMSAGERLSYPYSIVKSLLERHPTASIRLMYDIACKFQKYLQKTEDGQAMLERLILGVPVFHAVAHSASCQVQFNPRQMVTFGMADGEGMERLWSYLRPFARIVKEMTKAHRLDLLEDALLHYSNRKTAGLGWSLLCKLDLAEKQNEVCVEQKNDILQSLTDVTDGTILTWKEEEKAKILSAPKKSEKYSWDEKYAKDLRHFISLQSRKESTPIDELDSKLLHDLQSSEKKLSVVEKRQKMSRWETDSAQYKDALGKLMEKEKTMLLGQMQQLARERRLLLALKKKYFDGQAMAERLSGQVNKCCSKMKGLWKTYNSVYHPVKLAQVYEPSSPIYEETADLEEGVIPYGMKQHLVQLYLQSQQALQEAADTKEELLKLCASYEIGLRHHKEQVSESPGERAFLQKAYYDLLENYSTFIISAKTRGVHLPCDLDVHMPNEAEDFEEVITVLTNAEEDAERATDDGEESSDDEDFTTAIE